MADPRVAAQWYISEGFRPIPVYGVKANGTCCCGDSKCKPRDAGKHEPSETDGLWKSGLQLTPGDFRPGMNVALAMGPYTRREWLVCLDSDGRFPLSRHLGTLPPTMTAKSPRGMHHIFTVKPFAPLGNWVDCFQTKPGASLDLRYARGRVVVQPSRGAFGAYRWLSLEKPAPLPQRAIDAILNNRRERGLPVLETWERDGKRP